MAVNKMFIIALKRQDIDRALSLIITPGYNVNSTTYKDCTPLILSTKLGSFPHTCISTLQKLLISTTYCNRISDTVNKKLKLTCSRHDIAEKLLSWFKQQSLTHYWSVEV
jgi:hypothetical protein